MTYYNLMLLIKDILNENKNVSFGVESLLSEIKKNGCFTDDNQLRVDIRKIIDDLYNDSNYDVIKNGRKSIKKIIFNNEIKKKSSIDSQLVCMKQYVSPLWLKMVIFVSFLMFLNYLFVDEIFIYFTVTSFLILLLSILKTDISNIKNELTTKISLVAPIFTFIYYTLSDPVFSNYSFLSIDNKISSNNNIYFISISLFLSVLTILNFESVKSKTSFFILVIIILLFPYISFSILIYGIFCLFIFLLFKADKLKSVLFNKYFEIGISLYNEKNFFNIFIYCFVLQLLVIITLYTDDFKNSYYRHTSESNNDYCENLNEDLNVIKNNTKSGHVAISSTQLYIPIMNYFYTQNENVDKLKPLEHDIIIIKGTRLNDALSYNILLSVAQDFEKIGVKDLLISDRKKTKEYIDKNNKIVNDYIEIAKNAQNSKSDNYVNIFYYNCD